MEDGWVLTNRQCNRFLGEDNLGKFTKVTDISKAKIFTNAVKANNVLTNCLNKTEQSKWFVKSIFEVGNNMKIKQIETININDNDIDLIIDNLAEVYQKFTDIKKDMLELLTKLREQLSLADQELSDIYHFIAFENVKVTKWVKIFKILKELLLNRANIKNKIRKIQVLIDSFDKIFVFDKEKIVSDIYSVEHEVYTPRTQIYEKLFNL